MRSQSTALKTTTTINDSRLENDYETIQLNRKLFYKFNNQEFIDGFRQLYFNASKENVRNISEQQLRKNFSAHSKLDEKKIDYLNPFDITSNFAQSNNSSCQFVCQLISFCVVGCGISLLWICIYCSKRCPTTVTDGDDTQSAPDPAIVPAPIDYSKLYMIKCDSKGSCYASPLDDDEIPPLPSYNKALSYPTHPLPGIHEPFKSEYV